MRLIAVDPSSTRFGVAYFAGEDLQEAGIIEPHHARDDARDRIDYMMDNLSQNLDRICPSHAAIEVPSGRPGRGSRLNRGAGLALYGWAVGEVRRLLLERVGVVLTIDEQEWTKRQSKAIRANRVRMLYPDIADKLKEFDTGGDAHDAIGLGLYALDLIKFDR